MIRVLFSNSLSKATRFCLQSFKAPHLRLSRFYTGGGGCDDSRSAKGLVLGLYQKENDTDDPKLTTYAEGFDTSHEGRIVDLVKESRLTGELGQIKLFSAIDSDFGSVVVVGLGKEGIGYSDLEALDEGMENVRVASGLGARFLRDQGCTQIYVDPMDYPEQAAEGSALSIWRYQENKAKKSRLPIPKLELFDSPEVDAWTRGLFKADAQNLARTLCDAPANQLTPSAFAQTTVDALCPCGVNVEVRNMDWIESQRMLTFLAVAKSSCEPPLFLEINYCGDEKSDKPVLLLGSGLTFNSGGLCLKKPKGMSQYRASMSGAAAVVATIRAAAALSLPINLVGVVPLCENMPSGMAFKPGDVITAMNGKTIAVHDTQYAGRLIMADTLTFSQNTFKPKLVIDVATLCNGMPHAIGQGASGVFSNSDFIWKQIRKAGALSGDRVWRMPLWHHFAHNVTSFSNVDLSNTGLGQESACNAAAFLREFVPCVDWLHLDISGTGMEKWGAGIPYLEEGRMTGRPTRTLIQFLHQLACPDEQMKELH